jgi:hypothetical protein
VFALELVAGGLRLGSRLNALKEALPVSSAFQRSTGDHRRCAKLLSGNRPVDLCDGALQEQPNASTLQCGKSARSSWFRFSMNEL